MYSEINILNFSHSMANLSALTCISLREYKGLDKTDLFINKIYYIYFSTL